MLSASAIVTTLVFFLAGVVGGETPVPKDSQLRPWCGEVELSQCNADWEELLLLSAAGNNEAKTGVEGILKETANSAIRDLAEVLLEEWCGSIGRKEAEARLVFAPDPSKIRELTDQGTPPLASVVVRVFVDESGQVTDVDLVRSNGVSGSVVDFILAYYRMFRFRPAIGEAGYHESEKIMMFRVGH
jgi:hypothetical protein